jgi:hypothetical protein
MSDEIEERLAGNPSWNDLEGQEMITSDETAAMPSMIACG